MKVKFVVVFLVTEPSSSRHAETGGEGEREEGKQVRLSYLFKHTDICKHVHVLHEHSYIQKTTRAVN